MIKIEKDVPIPLSATRCVGRTPKYPTREMEVGDSFFVPLATAAARQKKRGSLYGIIARAEKMFPGRKYVLQSNEEGIRIWRKE